MRPRPIPTRSLPARPDLAQLKRQAKELLAAYRDRDSGAAAEVHEHFRGADPATFALHDAQLVLARAYGFESWPKLKAFVDGVTIRRLVEAIQAGDIETVRVMVDTRPELVQMDVGENDEHRALHHAVLSRHPGIVRVLMQRGADARKGIWPHRGATTAYTLAAERGDHEIVRVIEEEEQHRAARAQPAPHTVHSPAQANIAAPSSIETMLAELHAHPDLIVNGAGLVSRAVTAERPDIVDWLLRRGLDADEPGRLEGVEEVVLTWGEPLRTCARSGNLAMAEILLAHGANANTNVYAASSALYEAYRRGDERMVALLEAHGGRLTPVAIAELGLVAQADTLLAAVAAGQPLPHVPGAGTDVVWDLLWGAIESPSPEIVELALRVADWPADDGRWHGILENGLYLRPESDRARHLEAFRLVLERSDPNVPSRRGTTILHEIAASRGGLTSEDRLVYATLLLDRGARLDIRDGILQSTPLGWACRWGRVEMVELLLGRGADPIEGDAAAWATPNAWATKAGRPDILALLGEVARR